MNNKTGSFFAPYEFYYAWRRIADLAKDLPVPRPGGGEFCVYILHSSDASFYTDQDNQKWLFMVKKADQNAPFDSELFIYKTDSIKMENLVPHKQNPFIINAKTARNAGTIFSNENNVYRPSQANIDGIYGRGLNIYV